MKQSRACQKPLSWDQLDLSNYNLVFLPGGHEKGVRQIIDSPKIHSLLAAYVPLTRKPSAHALAAVCHGVMVLANTKDASGKSVLHDKTTTALAGGHEQGIFWATRAVLGDYYKTYGAESESVEESVKKVLDEPEKQWKGSLGFSPLVVRDERFNYVSARFPGDVPEMCKVLVEMVDGLVKA